MAGSPRQYLRPSFWMIGGGLFLALAALGWLGLFQPAELRLYDLAVTARARHLPSGDRVVLIGATDADIERFGWPASDALLARLLEAIAAQSPRAVGLDLYRDRPQPPGEAAFAAALRRHDNIIVVEKLPEGRRAGIAAPAELAGSERVGFADTVLDADGVLRRGLIYVDDGENVHEAFALRLALRHLAADGIVPRPGLADPAHLRLGATTLPPFEAGDGGYVDADAGGYQFLLDFAGGANPFPLYSFADVIDGRLPAGLLKGKVVLVGVTAQGVKDQFTTPLGLDDIAATVWGIAVHGHTVDQLLRLGHDGQAPLRVFADAWEAAWLAVCCLLGASLGTRLRGAGRLTVGIATGAVLILLGCGLLFFAGWWLPLLPALAGWLGSSLGGVALQAGRERAERALAMRIFSRHMSQQVADEIWRRRDEFLHGSGRLRPRRLTATVLFSDVRGFTEISERLDPQALMDWLNEYMTAMAALVAGHGGVVDKFIGDAVMAVFGAPIPSENAAQVARQAQNAVRCALAMEAAVAELNRRWAAQGLPAIGVRIGIHTGSLVAGSLGGESRMEYTVIGDTVNTASRLESLDKSIAEPGRTARILVSDATWRQLEDKFCGDAVGSFALKGKSEPVIVHAIKMVAPGG